MLIQPELHGIQNLLADLFPNRFGYPAEAKMAPGCPEWDSYC